MGKGRPYEECDDELLITRTLSGEKEAFSELVRRYQGKAYAVAVGILGNREEALDAVQDAFMKAYTSLKGFRFGSRFFTWFYRLLVNTSIDRLRARGKGHETTFDEEWKREDEMDGPSKSRYTDTPHKRLEREELGRVIKEAVELLPEHHRTVIILREVEGLSYEEIAGVLGISIGTVMSRIHYARGKLRETLSGYVRGE